MKISKRGWLLSALFVALFAWPSIAEANAGRYYRRYYGRVAVRPVVVLGAGGVAVVPVVVVRRAPIYSPVRVYRRPYY